MRLVGKTIIVTGAAHGIGRHYAASLASQGASLLLADLDHEAATILSETINEHCRRRAAVASEVDVRSVADTQRMAQDALQHFGSIDVLINNAGSYPHVDFENIDYDMWRDVIALNLDSVFLCTKAVVPAMKERGRGKIINISTNLIWVGLSGMAHYISAKAGVLGLTRSLARELGAHGITVNALAPGAVVPSSGLSAAGRKRVDDIVEYQCVRRPQTSEDLVGTIIYLASSDSDFVSGQIVTVDGGLTSH